MATAFLFNPNLTYDVVSTRKSYPVWRIRERKVYAYLEHDPRRDWSGEIGTLSLGTPQRLVDHDGQTIAYIVGAEVRDTKGRRFALNEVKD
ncbi:MULTISPECIES: hypothetical protein [Pseudomonas]|uniref:Uncharacterized protein n=1 Tax=Pseudomonas cichorii TaxID=36746 RepID=A0A3M4W4C1_PSECI|nr:MULTISPECIES: hypothetical protein [Pseudomonas]AHF67543.1 hypothetical protein PCH70_23900 [Pseudomonas cichorii JBC1]QVE19392.1 hypothetical protein KGD89_11940 [Pseudomonas cichorii]RMR58757.1 hypothetical protein ALP84_01231 [Pseudomonas cichorii]SDP22197.1 hypothetical protein SAMN05216599_1234 [Pseudomonas cichorii]GFM77721.1 hypothetical protein PSCICM_35400 [Pseudomonas cichorii]